MAPVRRARARTRCVCPASRGAWHRHADPLSDPAPSPRRLCGARLRARQLPRVGTDSSGGRQLASLAADVGGTDRSRHKRSAQRSAMTLLGTSLRTAIGTAVRMAVGLILNKLVAVYVGPAGLGQLAQLTTLAGVVNGITAGGVTTGVTRYVAEYADARRAAPIVTTALAVVTIAAFTSSALL